MKKMIISIVAICGITAIAVTALSMPNNRM